MNARLYTQCTYCLIDFYQENVVHSIIALELNLLLFRVRAY